MKTKIILLIATLFAVCMSSFAQPDDDFYRGSNEQKGTKNKTHTVTTTKTRTGTTIKTSKSTDNNSIGGNGNVTQEVTPDGPWVFSLGGFYGARFISFSNRSNAQVGKGDVNLKFKDLKGVSATIENKLFLIEARFGTAESLTLLSGKVYVGYNFMPMKRFHILAHAGIGAAYNKIDDELLEKNGLVSLDFGLKIRARYYLTNKIALYAAANGVLGISGKNTYNNVKMNTTAGEINGEAGFAFSF